MLQQHHIEKMPRFQAHKEVRALKIATLSGPADGKVHLTFADAYFPPIDLDQKIVDLHRAKPADYFVIDDDGQHVIWPAEAFEKGHFKRI
jgi:hypothetical protein